MSTPQEQTLDTDRVSRALLCLRRAAGGVEAHGWRGETCRWRKAREGAVAGVVGREVRSGWEGSRVFNWNRRCLKRFRWYKRSEPATSERLWRFSWRKTLDG